MRMRKNPSPAAAEQFLKAPIAATVFRNAIPAMLSMLLTLLYNLADTFFVGQTGDALQVAAVSVSTPAFMLFMSFGTIFGIGGASCISRNLGANDLNKVRRISSFCFWSGLIVGVIGMVSFLVFTNPILRLIGASEQTWSHAADYLRVVSIGAPFIILSNTFSHIVRTQGKPNVAVVGMVVGNLINIILDPLFILVFNQGALGAAVATTIANVFSGAYYIVFLLRDRSVLSMSLRDFTMKDRIAVDVLSIGLPGSLQSILMSVANIVVNNILVVYSDFAVAAMGVAMKIDMITSLLMIGLGQGILPIIGVNYGAKQFDRARKVVGFGAIFALVLGSVLTIVCWIGAGSIVQSFIEDASVQQLGIKFVRCLLTTGPIVGVSFVLTFTLQALGCAAYSLILSVTRQGLAYIPALYLLNWLFGLDGIGYALPVANLVALILSAVFYLRADRKARAGIQNHLT